MSYRRPIDEVLSSLGVDAEAGLPAAEASARLQHFGRNELQTEKGQPAWLKFLAQFQDVLVLLLLVATVISAILWVVERETALPYEALAIFGIVLANAILGFVQESRAESAVAALRKMSAAHARVVRDGEIRTIPAADVVPGDVLLIEEGDTIPGDARLIHTTALQTLEGALTGESLPVQKDTQPIAGEAAIGDQHNMIFSGTIATYGHGRAVVVATAMDTEMGHVAGLLKRTTKETTPLQKELTRLGKLLGIIVVAIAVVMIATILLVGDVHGFSAVFDVLILGVALAVAAVPEGLPAVVTAVLALGVQRAAKRNAIVRHLRAVEALGSASVIASDKTGTLTKNEMTVRTVVTASGRVRFGGTGYAPEGEVVREDGLAIDDPLRVELERTLAAADRASNAVLQDHDGRWSVQGDPTEGALIVAARKAGLDAETLGARFDRIGEVPFSSERKRMTTVHSDAEEQGRVMVMTKGAPDVLGLEPPEGGGVVLPLLATHLLWVNLVTDGAPALALGVDPADRHLMGIPPRPREEGVITPRMWGGIFFVGGIIALGTLPVLDASMPGGLIEGTGTLRYGQTMAFTTIVMFSIFTIFNARSDERSAFPGMFTNRWLWGAIALALALQAAVLYTPVLQDAFSTVPLTLEDWLLCTAVGSTVLWIRELSKFVMRRLTGEKLVLSAEC